MITIGVNNYMKDELLKGLTEEQIAKAKACKTQEELLALAKEEGINLTEEQLQTVTGGSACLTTPNECPKCHSHDIETDYGVGIGYFCTCNKCGHEWKKLIY